MTSTDKLELHHITKPEFLPKSSKTPGLELVDLIAYQFARGLVSKSPKGPENEIQIAFEKILTEPFHKKDWGGEYNDLYTSNITINGARRTAAFLLKGNGLKKKTVCNSCHCYGIHPSEETIKK